MERQIPYILHLSDFFSRLINIILYDLLMYYCLCVIMLSKYIFIIQNPYRSEMVGPMVETGNPGLVNKT